jgi:hypothetical protein
LTTTNEVDDLEPIIVAQLCGKPVAAAHDFAIQFHGDSSSRQI